MAKSIGGWLCLIIWVGMGIYCAITDQWVIFFVWFFLINPVITIGAIRKILDLIPFR